MTMVASTNTSRPMLAQRQPHDKYKVLADSMANFSQSVNVMAIQFGANSHEQQDEKPAADGKMSANAKYPVLLKNHKEKKE